MILEPQSDLIKIYNNDSRKTPRAFTRLEDAVVCIINGMDISSGCCEDDDTTPVEAKTLSGAYGEVSHAQYANGDLPFNSPNTTSSGIDIVDGKMVIKQAGYYAITSTMSATFPGAAGTGNFVVYIGSAGKLKHFIYSDNNGMRAKSRAFQLAVGDMIWAAQENAPAGVDLTSLDVLVTQIN